jgi:hypothetical protein
MTDRGCAGKELGRRSGGHFRKEGGRVWEREMKLEERAGDSSSPGVLMRPSWGVDIIGRTDHALRPRRKKKEV